MDEKDLIKILNPYKNIVERIVPGKVPIDAYLEHVARYIFASSFIKNNDVVVDVACGTGYGSYVLARKGGKKIIGIDISKIAIEYAKSKYRGRVNNIEFLVGNAMKMPISSSKVDVVVSFETIEHLNDPEKFLSECRRVLKDGGLLILSTPNKYIKRHDENPYHINELYIIIEELLSLLHNSKFDIVDIYCQIPVKNTARAREYSTIPCGAYSTYIKYIKNLYHIFTKIIPFFIKNFHKKLWYEKYYLPKITKVPYHLLRTYEIDPDSFEEWIIEHGVDQRYLPIKLSEVESYKNTFYVFVIIAVAR